MTLFSSLVKDWLFREASVFDLITSQGSVTLSTRSGGKNGGELAGLDIDIGRANCRERRRRLIFQYISMRFPGCPKHSQNRYLYFVFFLQIKDLRMFILFLVPYVTIPHII